MTLEEFLKELKNHPYSRVPVFEDSVDKITGIAFSHDLLQIKDEDAHTRTVASIQRPAAFVPETKKVNELLREMQREKQHMRIVIDEYGGVAGVVTIEDLLEEIVGAITDEHEEDDTLDKPVREADGTWVVPGTLEVDHLEGLLRRCVGKERRARGGNCCRTGKRNGRTHSAGRRGGGSGRSALRSVGVDGSSH